MANIKAFSFYKSYYDALNEVSEDDKKEIIFAMINYVFEDKKPKFSGIKKLIWTLIEPNLNTSKNRSNGNSGAPVGNKNACKTKENEEKEETIKKQSKNNQNSINDIKSISYSYSLSYSLSSSISYSNSNIINNSILNNLFIEYIKLREHNKYPLSEVVISRLINKLENAENDDVRKEMIEQAIVGGWKDFYPIEESKQKSESKKIEEGVYKLC